jgi:EAL domain-containing protein (putative c-di-GMP-specific phosphodiesterase class I)
VTHITLSKKTTSKPSLEFYSDGGGEARRVTLEQMPFKIGRAESADLRVESAEISREHAEIVERNGVFLIRDLGSTNGTQLNGKPVKESLLNDGDILKVAQTELTFVASSASQFQRMVTQPIAAKKESASALSMLPPEVAATRMMTEATLWQAIPTQLLSVVSLRSGATEAFFAPSTADVNQQPLFDQPHAVGDRYRELERMRAVEQAVAQASGGTDANRLFLAVGAAETETPHRLFSSLKQVQGLLPGGWELGITVSLPTDVDILRITEVYREARDHALLVAFDEFLGNGAQVMHLESLLPDYLLLAASMTKDLTGTRQPLRRLESLLQACEELVVKPVLPRNESAHAIALCQEIGFDFVLQSASSRAAPQVAAVLAETPEFVTSA